MPANSRRASRAVTIAAAASALLVAFGASVAEADLFGGIRPQGAAPR